VRKSRRLCPFVEWEDARCASRLSLGGIGETYRLCAGDPLLCPAYREIRREQLQSSAERRLACSA
jgi:hypothetical protein